MVYPTLRAPFADLYTFTAFIGSGVGSETYHVTENATGRTRLLKHISIPASQTQVQALIYSGAASDEESAKAYFQQLAETYQKELELTKSLRGNPTVRLYDEIQIDEKENEIGFDVYLVCTPMVSLGAYLEENAMTQLRAVNLGIDLCVSAETIRSAGLLNYNIKPSNIFLNDAGHFVCGDLGFAQIDELDFSSMPDNQFCSYSAPEFSDLLNHLNLTADIYSIGMILYRIFNGNHGPFVDEQTSSKAAEKLRLDGTPLPAPLYADYELAAIIQKACAFAPEDRYSSPGELRQVLVDYLTRNQIDDILIVPPIISDPDSLLTQEAMEEVIEPIRFADVNQMQEEFVSHLSPNLTEPETPPPPSEPEPEAAPSVEGAPDSPKSDAEVESEAEKPAPASEALTDNPSEDVPPPVNSTNSVKEKAPAGNKRKTIVLLASIAVLVAIVAASIIYYLRLPVEVYSISEVSRSVDEISVEVQSSAAQDTLILTCADAYGNTFTGTPTEDGAFQFTGLSSNTPYTITVESAKGRRVTGNSSTTISTPGMTSILSFDVSEAYETGVEISLTASGPEPVSWNLEISAEGAEPRTVSFSGHSARITNLSPATDYTFTLLDLADYTLEGTRTCTASTLESVEDITLRAVAAQQNSLEVEWTYAGTDTDTWSITCTDSSGASQTYTAESMPGAGETCRYTIPDLQGGETYTISVLCDGMRETSAPSITVTQPVGAISGFDATVQDGILTLRWKWADGSEACDLVVSATAEGAQTPEQQFSIPADGTSSCALEGLNPDIIYVFSLQTTDGILLPGASQITVSISGLMQIA